MGLLDPYFRTMRGFEVLVEKDWLSFGHMFEKRCGHGNGAGNSGDTSPVFVQFLDCIWQLSQQFPASFEFNNEFLMFLADEVYSCRFGTFLFNCERERKENNLAQTTRSIWSHV